LVSLCILVKRLKTCIAIEPLPLTTIGKAQRELERKKNRERERRRRRRERRTVGDDSEYGLELHDGASNVEHRRRVAIDETVREGVGLQNTHSERERGRTS
jgi:hypothetical protein